MGKFCMQRSWRSRTFLTIISGSATFRDGWLQVLVCFSYKPPLPNRSRDLQHGVLHLALETNMFLSKVDYNLGGRAVYSGTCLSLYIMCMLNVIVCWFFCLYSLLSVGRVKWGSLRGFTYCGLGIPVGPRTEMFLWIFWLARLLGLWDATGCRAGGPRVLVWETGMSINNTSLLMSLMCFRRFGVYTGLFPS